MIAKVVLEIRDDMAHGDSVAASIAKIGSVPKRNHPHLMPAVSLSAPACQQVLCDVGGVVGRTAAKPCQRDSEHYRVAHRMVEASCAFFHFADDHVRPIGWTRKRWIWVSTSEMLVSSATNDVVGRRGESHGEDVNVGQRSGVTMPRSFNHRVLDDGEVAVQLQVRLN